MKRNFNKVISRFKQISFSLISHFFPLYRHIPPFFLEKELSFKRHFIQSVLNNMQMLIFSYFLWSYPSDLQSQYSCLQSLMGFIISTKFRSNGIIAFEVAKVGLFPAFKLFQVSRSPKAFRMESVSIQNSFPYIN